jgi:hypothetical protein
MTPVPFCETYKFEPTTKHAPGVLNPVIKLVFTIAPVDRLTLTTNEDPMGT